MGQDLPVLIQGGMGVAVSDWRLAGAVSAAGHLGVVSGTALDVVLVRRLQLGDPGGHVRRALDALPMRGAAEGILDRYYIPGGKQSDQRFKMSSIRREKPSRNLEDLIIAGNFVEVFLAKEGHDGPVGINFLEKIQSPTLPSLYGAMLAGVDFVLMGAGIPRTMPAVLNNLAEGRSVDMRLDVRGATKDDDFKTEFDPAAAMGEHLAPVKRPKFLAIVSSHVLAIMLATKIDVPVDGFIVEAPTAGGHNAPPRGKLQLTDGGEPIYGARDVPDFGVIADLGLPFWLAGGNADPKRITEALDLGATGVQVGTAFAFCEESGFDPEVKRQVIEMARSGDARVFTDPLASPSGFPFKVVQLDGTLSNDDVYTSRERQKCDLGFLRTAYKGSDGKFTWRCPSEPVAVFLRKGGSVEEVEGRKCLCNSLLANVGLGQIQEDGNPEPMLITSGDEISQISRFIPDGADTYTARDVINFLLPGS
ncbi:MAG: nitronate monooxygenase [Actinomycetia bacterium]|nr:nitronate monooxygenase [Actinomycetes bacterium]MCP4962321.1 nitronate monooxygenase [Actinomycetes bacterium]